MYKRQVHTSVENSREIIKSVLAADETYAVCLREDNAVSYTHLDVYKRQEYLEEQRTSLHLRLPVLIRS